MIAGGLLMTAPIIGLLGTVLGMTQAFRALGSSGIGDPQAISEGIGTTLISTMVGLILFPLGVAILTFSSVLFFRLSAVSPPPIPTHSDSRSPES